MNDILELPFVTKIKPFGHITVPEDIRNALELGPGDTILLTVQKVKLNIVNNKKEAGE